MTEATLRSSVRLPRTYVALGDSFSAGTPACDTPWPDLVATRLRAARPDLRYENLALAGCSSREVLDRQLEPALAMRPDLVSLVCGANDVLLNVRPDERAFRRTLDEILARLNALPRRPRVITATYPPVAPAVLRPRTRHRVTKGLERFNSAIRELSTAHHALCLDWADHEEVDVHRNYADDRFHPSDRGHRLTAEAFLAAVA